MQPTIFSEADYLSVYNLILFPYYQGLKYTDCILLQIGNPTPTPPKKWVSWVWH